jgi:hypothetical protein
VKYNENKSRKRKKREREKKKKEKKKETNSEMMWSILNWIHHSETPVKAIADPMPVGLNLQWCLLMRIWKYVIFLGLNAYLVMYNDGCYVYSVLSVILE